jgi:hypothetical protein
MAILDVRSDGIVVLSGSGRKLLRIEPPPPSRQDQPEAARIEHKYTSPDVHPDQSRVVYLHETSRIIDSIRWEDVRRRAQTVDDWVELKVAMIATGAERVIYAPPGGTYLASPKWSPSGDRLAFLEGKDLVVMDGALHRELSRVRDVLLTPVISDRQTSLQWAGMGSMLFVDALGDCLMIKGKLSCSGIGRIDLSSSAISWLGPDGFLEQRTEIGSTTVLVCGKAKLRSRIPS